MLKLYDKTFSTLYGTLSTVTEALVEEERNGLFELSFVMLNTDSLFSYIEKENIVVCNANDTLLNQKFRIYNIRKLMNNRVEVFARHISFDLMYDYIDSLSFENQSCEYALNQLFRLSNFSTHYKGYSDIVNAQNYNISNVNLLSAIGGTEGSILDTFGNGAEILRDNENIHVLNRRGNDNSVTIEYRKNLTGFELEEDTTDLVTRILPYAKYTPEGGEETTVKASYVDSPLINNYSHPFIKSIDYTDKFENDEVPTTEKLIQLAEKEYTVNRVDIPKQNYKIEFIPLSKCVGYEALNDKISLCDTVTIKDTRYNINTQSKVIKTTFNVLKNRYESIELGEPKTSLGDIISSSSDNKVTEKEVKDIVSSTPSTNYPNTLPAIPTLESFVYGFANIELRWTFENKVYYAYEVYASKTKGFTPNTFDLIYQGQASSYMFQAQPNETWYFKVCGINSYNKRTAFSNEVEVVTTKIEDLSNYVDNMAIGEALIGELNLGRGWVGQLNANLLDVKGNFSVTDGNGRRTFDIDSYGNVNLQATTLKMIVDGAVEDIATKSQLEQTSKDFTFRFSQEGTPNEIYNGCPTFSNTLNWSLINSTWKGSTNESIVGFQPLNNGVGYALTDRIYLNKNTYYSFSCKVFAQPNVLAGSVYVLGYSNANPDVIVKSWHMIEISDNNIGQWLEGKISDIIPDNVDFIRFRIAHTGFRIPENSGTYSSIVLTEFQARNAKEYYPSWSPNPNEVYNASTRISPQGLSVYNGLIEILNQSNNRVFWVDDTGRLCADNIYIFGGERLGNLEIRGTNNKGIVIRSEDGGDRYIDFSNNPVTTSFEEETVNGKLARLIATEDKFYIMPSRELIINACNVNNPTLESAAVDTKVFEVTGELKSKVQVSSPNAYISKIYAYNTPNIDFSSPVYFGHDVQFGAKLKVEEIYHSSGSSTNAINFRAPINMNGNSIINTSTLQAYSLINDEELNTTYMIESEDGEVYIDNNKATKLLLEENKELKKQQFEQDELLIENAFEIANIKLGVI